MPNHFYRTFLHIYFSCGKYSTQDATEKLLRIFGVCERSGAPRLVSGLNIRGKFPVLDFSGLIVTESNFHSYRNLMSCRFGETKFMYSTFVDCADLAVKKTQLLPSLPMRIPSSSAAQTEPL